MQAWPHIMCCPTSQNFLKVTLWPVIICSCCDRRPLYTYDSTEMSKLQILGHLEAFCLSSSVQVLPPRVTTPRDSYVLDCREMATLLALSESLAEDGFEPLTIRSMRKKLTIEISLHPKPFLLTSKTPPPLPAFCATVCCKKYC